MKHYHQLISYGDQIELETRCNPDRLLKEIKDFEWKQYNPRKEINRYGLSVTSLDGGLSGIPDLDSLFVYNQKYNTDITEKEINIKTDVANKVSAIHPILDIFKTLGRSHL